MGVAGLTKNKANSAQLGLAGAWAELGNYANIMCINAAIRLIIAFELEQVGTELCQAQSKCL